MSVSHKEVPQGATNRYPGWGLGVSRDEKLSISHLSGAKYFFIQLLME